MLAKCLFATIHHKHWIDLCSQHSFSMLCILNQSCDFSSQKPMLIASWGFLQTSLLSSRGCGLPFLPHLPQPCPLSSCFLGRTWIVYCWKQLGLRNRALHNAIGFFFSTKSSKSEEREIHILWACTKVFIICTTIQGLRWSWAYGRRLTHLCWMNDEWVNESSRRLLILDLDVKTKAQRA